MTQQQVEDRTALALRKFKTLNADAAKLILSEKAEVIRRSGLLKYQEPLVGGLQLIGGCDNVKDHIRRDRACFSEQARAFGIDPPRGLLLVGVPGCGKTAISLSAAAELGMPLIQFDVASHNPARLRDDVRRTCPLAEPLQTDPERVAAITGSGWTATQSLPASKGEHSGPSKTGRSGSGA